MAPYQYWFGQERVPDEHTEKLTKSIIVAKGFGSEEALAEEVVDRHLRGLRERASRDAQREILTRASLPSVRRD